MTQDYDERTSVLSYRFFFGWTGGTMMGFYTLTYLLPSTNLSNGLFNIQGYGQMGLIAAILIFTTILISGHRYTQLYTTVTSASNKRKKYSTACLPRNF
jgi:Na+/melibiose symporter-like transporter